MSFVWGFGAPKPNSALQPQVVAADEDAEGVSPSIMRTLYSMWRVAADIWLESRVKHAMTCDLEPRGWHLARAVRLNPSGVAGAVRLNPSGVAGAFRLNPSGVAGAFRLNPSGVAGAFRLNPSGVAGALVWLYCHNDAQALKHVCSVVGEQGEQPQGGGQGARHRRLCGWELVNGERDTGQVVAAARSFHMMGSTRAESIASAVRRWAGSTVLVHQQLTVL